MLQVSLIREQKQQVIERLAVKNFDSAAIIESILDLDEQRRGTQKKLDDALSEANILAREIGNLFKQGKKEEADKLKAKTVDLKQFTREMNDRLDLVTREQTRQLEQLPNLPHPSVPKGRSAADNEIVHQEGVIPELGESAVPHWDLASKYDIIDFDLGSKVTGAGFPFYKGKGARLQRALINFFLDRAVEAGYF